MGAKKKKAKKKKHHACVAQKKKAKKKKAKKGLRNAGKNCWTPCHKKNGKCAWCGTGVCCRHGWKKGGCDGKQGAKKHHACVAQKKAEKKKTEKKKAEKTYPQCSVKMHWMRRHWRSNPFYKKKGVDGTTSSIKQYLGCVEKYCAPPKGGCKSAVMVVTADKSQGAVSIAEAEKILAVTKAMVKKTKLAIDKKEAAMKAEMSAKEAIDAIEGSIK